MEDGRLTKYECARVLGIRVLQLNHNSRPLVPTTPGDTFLKIACLELQQRKFSVVVRRTFPGGQSIEVCSDQLELPEDLNCLADSIA